MAKFRFPFATALQVRQWEADREKARLEQLRVERDRLLAAAAELRDLRTAEDTVLTRPGAAHTAVAVFSVDQFHQYANESQRFLASNRAVLETRIAEQTRQLVEARRKVKLLERLQEKKFAEWKHAADLELEQLAADSHTARMARTRRGA